MTKGTFRFADGPVEHDREAIYLYSDDFFRRDARLMDADLRRMSFALCMACFPSTEAENYERVYRYAEKMLGEIGFEDFTVNDDYLRPPEKDTLGILAAHKIIREGEEDCSVVAVGLRGADYGDEWADNILLGESGEATGFARGATYLDSFLRAYLEQLGERLCPRVKFWLSGYSRVAAIVNLLGAKIDREAADYGTRVEDLYVYTFECPAAAPATETRAYPSIHNYINPHDLVPYLAPAAWGFCRYGVDDGDIPRMGSEKFLKKIGPVKDLVAKLNPDMKYDVDRFRPVFLAGSQFVEARTRGGLRGKRRPAGWLYRARQDEFLERFLDFMSKTGVEDLDGPTPRIDAERRRLFKERYETSAAMAAGLYFGASSGERHRMRKNIEDLVDLDLQGLRKVKFYLLLRSETEKSCRKAGKMLGELMRERVRKTDRSASRQRELDRIYAAVGELLHFFLKCASVDAKRNHFAFLPTLIHNLDRIVVSHMPEVIYAWLNANEQ